MENNTEDQNNMHFPVDREAPVNSITENDLNVNFYNRNKNLIDIVVLFLISVSTVLTVSLSLYIIISKYF